MYGMGSFDWSLSIHIWSLPCNFWYTYYFIHKTFDTHIILYMKLLIHVCSLTCNFSYVEPLALFAHFDRPYRGASDRNNPNKTTGTDQVPCCILKELFTTLALVLAAIFTQSLETGTPAIDLEKTAFISPIFKKGATYQAENCCPVSLTCITCKMLEHIICHHARSHLDRHGILSPLQHGFRSGHSCEAQLVTTMYHLLSIWESGCQTDVIELDFSKAFHKVPYKRLLNKLRPYCISEPIYYSGLTCSYQEDPRPWHLIAASPVRRWW